MGCGGKEHPRPKLVTIRSWILEMRSVISTARAAEDETKKACIKDEEEAGRGTKNGASIIGWHF